MNDIPTITKRRLQAEVIQPIYTEMVRVVGEDTAKLILTRAIRESAILEAKNFSRREAETTTSLRSFIELFKLWTTEGALEIEIHEQTDTVFSFDVTRCKYAEMYRDMGLDHIGKLLSCNRDKVFCQGYDSNIQLEREQTIMDGSDRCTFRYRYTDSKS